MFISNTRSRIKQKNREHPSKIQRGPGKLWTGKGLDRGQDRDKTGTGEERERIGQRWDRIGTGQESDRTGQGQDRKGKGQERYRTRQGQIARQGRKKERRAGHRNVSRQSRILMIHPNQDSRQRAKYSAWTKISGGSKKINKGLDIQKKQKNTCMQPSRSCK